MKRPLAHVIQRRAEKTFEHQLPDEWVDQPESRDYGVDYRVRIVEADLLTADEFFVQVRGTTRLRVSGDEFSFTVKREHLVYWVDQLKVPVLLVVVDVTSRTAYWLPIQPYALRNLPDGWRNKKTVSVRIPKANRLDDTERVRRAIAEVQQFQQTRWPGSPVAAIVAAEDELTRRDPRFLYRLTATRTARQLEISARRPVTVDIQVANAGPDLRARLERAFSHGEPTTILPGELRAPGFPVHDEILSQPGVLNIARSVAGSVVLRAVGADRTELGRLPELRGELRGGSEAARFVGSAPGCPVALAIAFDADEFKARGGFNTSLLLDLRVWQGREVRELGYIEALQGFFDALACAHRVAITFLREGHPVLELEADPSTFGGGDFCSVVFARARRCRDIAQVTQAEVSFDLEYLLHEGAQILTLAAYLAPPASTFKAHPFHVATTVDLAQSQALLNDQHTLLVLEHAQGWVVPFFSGSVLIGPHQVCLNRTELRPSRRTLKRRLRHGSRRPCSIRVSSTADSDFWISRYGEAKAEYRADDGQNTNATAKVKAKGAVEPSSRGKPRSR